METEIHSRDEIFMSYSCTLFYFFVAFMLDIYMYVLSFTRFLLNSAVFSYRTCCRSWPDNAHALQACFKLMAVAKKHGIKSFVGEQNLQEVYSHVRLNLCSASHVVRLLTLKILSCFDQPDQMSLDDKVRYNHETLCIVLQLFVQYFYSNRRSRFKSLGLH